jgi:phosphonate transport system substrate-binding protein
VGPAITIGEISDDPEQVINNTRRVANYLTEHLSAFGIACGKVKVVENVNEMIAAINKGEVDIYWDSLFPAALVSDATGAQPILRRWRNCDPEYYSIIFTTTDSGITSLEELPSHMIAMDRPDSTSGFVLPSAYLIGQGLNLVVKEAYDEPLAGNQVGITFTYDDQNTLALVLAGKVSAGATDDYLYSTWEVPPPKKLVVLGKTEAALRQAVLVRPDLESDLQTAIKDTLLEAPLNPDGLAALDEAAHTCKFDEVPGGIQGSFEQMHLMHSKIQMIQGWPEALEK